jgi:hypothetical protein
VQFFQVGEAGNRPSGPFGPMHRPAATNRQTQSLHATAGGHACPPTQGDRDRVLVNIEAEVDDSATHGLLAGDYATREELARAKVGDQPSHVF